MDRLCDLSLFSSLPHLRIVRVLPSNKVIQESPTVELKGAAELRWNSESLEKADGSLVNLPAPSAKARRVDEPNVTATARRQLLSIRSVHSRGRGLPHRRAARPSWPSYQGESYSIRVAKNKFTCRKCRENGEPLKFWSSATGVKYHVGANCKYRNSLIIPDQRDVLVEKEDGGLLRSEPSSPIMPQEEGLDFNLPDKESDYLNSSTTTEIDDESSELGCAEDEEPHSVPPMQSHATIPTESQEPELRCIAEGILDILPGTTSISGQKLRRGASSGFYECLFCRRAGRQSGPRLLKEAFDHRALCVLNPNRESPQLQYLANWGGSSSTTPSQLDRGKIWECRFCLEHGEPPTSWPNEKLLETHWTQCRYILDRNTNSGASSPIGGENRESTKLKIKVFHFSTAWLI